jgi:plasmid stabilization system protein ParE
MQDKALVRWTQSATKDLREIIRYIRRDNPTAARSVAKALYDQAENLSILSGREEGQEGFQGRAS